MKPLIDTYKIHNESRVKHDELNDCTVISLAAATCGSYTKAHARMRLFGQRPHRRPMHIHPVATALGFEEVGGIGWDNRVTLKDFCATHPVGRYWLCTRGHALAVIDGQIHDHKLAPRRMVYAAYRASEQQLRIEHHDLQAS